MKSIVSGESFLLQSGDLKAEILTPWSGVYRRTRFAHTGFVSGLWLGDVRFTEAERAQTHQQSTGGIGLCSEYKCPKVEMDSAVGEDYLKIGVGVLKRLEEPWRLVDTRCVDALPASVCASADAAVFECLSPAVNGYAYREKRTLLLKGHVLHQEIEMENTGEKVLDISEYCHNFVSLGGLTTDETHRLELPCLKEPQTLCSNGFTGTEYGATWTGPMTGSYCCIREDSQPAQPYAWRLSSSRTSASIAEVLDFSPGLVVLWGTEYCVSAEVYKDLHILPGETARWMREWHVAI